MNVWFHAIGGFLFAMQAVGCFHQRDVLVNLPLSQFLNFYGTASLIFSSLFFGLALRAYKAPSKVQVASADKPRELLMRPEKRLSECAIQ